MMHYLTMVIFIFAIILSGCSKGEKTIETKKNSTQKKLNQKKEVLRQVIHLGIIPRRPARITHQIFFPLVKYLEEKTDTKINLIISKDYPAFDEKLKSGLFDLTHVNHLQYVRIRKTLGYEVLVMNEEFGSSQHRSAIYVKKGSPYKSLKELKGKRIIFGGGKSAFIAYLGTSKLLKDAGLEKEDYKTEFAKNPVNALIALARGNYDAAGAGAVAIKFPLVTKEGDDKKVRILALAKPHPHLPWAVKKTMKAQLKKKFLQAFLSLKKDEKGRAILKNARLTGFIRVRDKAYDRAEEILKEMK